MSKIEFKQLEFEELSKTEVKAKFLKRYYFIFDKNELDSKLKNLKISKNSIISEDDEKTLNKEFSKILDKGFQNLMNSVTRRKTIYIHQNSSIPLIGTNYIGIVDRNTNCIEIKPSTGCNLNCIYCSVDEGFSEETNKKYDFLVEKDYLVNELKKLCALKEKNISEKGLEIHIGPQGEPLLYPELTELIYDMRNEIKSIKRISMDTNGLMLNEKYVDELVGAGLTRFNISLNSVNKKTCDKMSNRNYNLDHLIKIIKYIDDKYASKGKCELILAPVLLSEYNDSEEELDAFMKFAVKISGLNNGIKAGFQNFLSYPRGRNPSKQKTWEEFFDILKKLENKYKTKLIFDAKDFLIEKNDVLKKPFRKDENLKVEIKCPGMYKNDRIAIAGERKKENERAIMIHNCPQEKGTIRVKITREKHNVFDGVAL